MTFLCHYQNVLADFTAKRQEIESLLQRDLKQELMQVDAVIGQLQAEIARYPSSVASANGNGAPSIPDGIYMGLRT